MSISKAKGLKAVRTASIALHLHIFPFALRFDLIHVLEYEIRPEAARSGQIFFIF